VLWIGTAFRRSIGLKYGIAGPERSTGSACIGPLSRVVRVDPFIGSALCRSDGWKGATALIRWIGTCIGSVGWNGISVQISAVRAVVKTLV
jgi:hypothetical protein